MKKLILLFGRRLNSDNADGSLARWACAGGTVGVLILATVFYIQARPPVL